MRDELRQRLRTAWVPGLILLVAFVLFVAAAYPGYQTYDSFDQLLQARRGPLTDWHPPFMAFTWRMLEHLWAGPQLMLMLQGALFLAGTTVILARFMRLRTAAIVAALVFHSPAVVAPMVVIWKDCQMAGFLLAGVAAMTSKDRRWKIAGCVLLVFATAVRYNAAAATAPLVIALFTWSDAFARWKRYALAAGVWLAITVAALGIDALLVEKHLYPFPNSVALLDIAGVIHYSHLTNDDLREILDGVPLVDRDHVRERIDKTYRPYEWLPLTGGDLPVFIPPADEAQRDAVMRAWKELITSHAGSYLHHRWRGFLYILELKGGENGGHVWTGFHGAEWEANVLNDHRKQNYFQRRWGKTMRLFDRTLIFKPWFYFLLAICMLPLAFATTMAFALLLSGLAYELALFVIAPSSDPRYSHWMIVCTIVGLILVFSTRWAAATRVRHGEP